MSSNVLDFSGRRIVVTGAGSGIGRATARLAVSLGAEVIAWDLKGTEAIARELSADGGSATGIDCNVADRRAVEAAAAKVSDVFAVVASAGIIPLVDWEEDDFDEVFDRTQSINVKGFLNIARTFLPGMERQKEGRIVGIGSVSGRTASASCASYAASKGALHAVARWLAIRVAQKNILVNVIAPGPIATDMIAGREELMKSRIPLGRLGHPEDIAWSVMYLCSPMASFSTGSILDVNGGIFIG